MSTQYDIGVGRCSAIEGDTVYVRLDALIAKRLAPESPWNRSGTSVLRCNRKYCSDKRPPKVDEELYFDSGALARHPRAEMDTAGDGMFRAVDLTMILKSMTPVGPAPSPSSKSSFARGLK